LSWADQERLPQDEFEGMEQQREKLDPSDEESRRRLKMRQLGTMRLLAELYNRDLLIQAVMKIVVSQFLERSIVDGVYDSDLIECLVQVRGRFRFGRLSAASRIRPCNYLSLVCPPYWHDVCLKTRSTIALGGLV
jgi:hypothetical protein